MSLQYISPKGYHYKQQKDGSVLRVSSLGKAGGNGQYVDLKKAPRPPRVGDKIKIIVKPYHLKKFINGIVKRVLTKARMHRRGHKVMLQDGTVGRTVEIYIGGQWRK